MDGGGTGQRKKLPLDHILTRQAKLLFCTYIQIQKHRAIISLTLQKWQACRSRERSCITFFKKPCGLVVGSFQGYRQCLRARSRCVQCGCTFLQGHNCGRDVWLPPHFHIQLHIPTRHSEQHNIMEKNREIIARKLKLNQKRSSVTLVFAPPSSKFHAQKRNSAYFRAFSVPSRYLQHSIIFMWAVELTVKTADRNTRDQFCRKQC